MAVLRESPWYQEILEEGREQGIEQGLEQGLEQGREQARKARQDDLRRVLTHRFGELPADVEEMLAVLGLDQLDQLFDAALDAATLEEFRAHFPPANAESDGDLGSPSLSS